MDIVRVCTRCSQPDTSKHWPSLDAAGEAMGGGTWACPNCAWPEYEFRDAGAPLPTSRVVDPADLDPTSSSPGDTDPEERSMRTHAVDADELRRVEALQRR